jgi:hypothetical protein
MAEDKTHAWENPVAALRCSINTIYGDKMRRISVWSVLLASTFAMSTATAAYADSQWTAATTTFPVVSVPGHGKFPLSPEIKRL